MTLTLAAAALIVAGFVARATAGPPWALLLPNPATVAVPLLLVALVTLAQRFAPRALPAALVAWLLAVASAWPRACGPIGDGPDRKSTRLNSSHRL